MGRGAAPSGVPALLGGDVKYLVVHCSATPGTRDLDVKDIDRMHRLNGWLGCGYHYVIKRDGAVQQGRALTQRGAHVEDYNWCSIGICLIGGVDAKLKPEANFTPAQLKSLKLTLQSLQHHFPTAAIQGHRDFPHVAKACPSFDVRHWLKTGTVKP
jgi:N-acetylmuramoyl-L-alanine amidase